MLGELRCSSASSKQVLMQVPMLSSTQKQHREAETYSSERNLFGARCEVRRRKSLRGSCAGCLSSLSSGEDEATSASFNCHENYIRAYKRHWDQVSLEHQFIIWGTLDLLGQY